MKQLFYFLLLFFSSNLIFSQTQVGTGQIDLTGVGTYTQNFDSLASSGTSSTLPYGWYFIETGSNANTTYTAGNGSGTTGDTYSFGTTSSSDRALGGLLSSTLTPMWGAKFYNNTGYTITQLPVTYTGEMWRLGTADRSDRIDFQYSLDATSLNNGNWIDVNELDFYSPNTSGTAGQRDGNSSQYRTTLSYTITGLNIPNGSTFWIRWTDYNATNADDGLSVDDFSIDQSNLPVELISFNFSLLDNYKIKLFWTTATETQNYGWEIERAKIDNTNKPSLWQTIGFVKGSGNSNSPKEYSFVDNTALYGEYNYRLKQIDIDGATSYSDELRVVIGQKPKVYDLKSFPNPMNPVAKIRYEIPETGNVNISIYDITGRYIKTIINEVKEAGIYEIDFDGSQLTSGIYISVLKANGITISRKLQLIK